jgi:hypothetical protein
MTSTVTSADGTRIAYDRKGSGPAVILVPAVLSTRAFDPFMSGLMDLLSDRFSCTSATARWRRAGAATPSRS